MLELRRDLSVDDVEGRTLAGRALTYRRSYSVSDDNGRSFYTEAWAPGALAASIEACRNSFELRALHRDVRVGLVTFEDSHTDLRFRATVDGSDEGDQLLADVEALGMPQVSLGFRPRGERRDRSGVLWRLRAMVRELSVTDKAQYPDARVLALRDLPDPPPPDPALERRLAALSAVLRRADAWKA